MGEIRSTLDIIMERTKNLSLTPEEKKKLHQQEWLGKARGWIQKYLDEVVGLEELTRELAHLGDPAGAKDDLKGEVLAAVDPDEDQTRRWEVLEEIWQVPRKVAAAALEDCRLNLSRSEVQWAESALKRLAEQGISGTAVVPNLTRDPEWTLFRESAVRECRERLRQIK